MKKRVWLRSGLIFVLSLSLLLFASFLARAEEAKYIYDDLGRLYQVIDEQGNVATYNYDAVGNLLSITRSTGWLPTPIVTGISPDSARVGDTVDVTIYGNFLSNARLTTDNSGINISNVQVTDSLIKSTFNISSHARQGLTTVTISNTMGLAQVPFVVNPPLPTINTLLPASGPVARLVQIIGTGFSNIPSENVVRFNGVVAPVYSCTTTNVLTSVPVGATSGLVRVTTNNGVSNGVNFTVASASGPPPTISSITPNVGSVEGGEKVIISGSGFTYDSKALICQNAVAGITVVNGSTLSIVTAPGMAGVCDVQVGNVNGDALSPGGFTYISGSPQKIIGINPPAGISGVSINTPIAALFSRPVVRTTINNESFSLIESVTSAPVAGTFSFELDDKIVNFAPQSALKPNTAYKLNISTGVKSVDGLPMNQVFTSTFKTSGTADTASPTVAVNPADHAAGMPLNTKIVFVFSEPINPTTLNSSTVVVTNNGMPVSGSISFNSLCTVATFGPSSSLLPNSYVNVALSPRVTDMAGNHIVGSGGVGTFFTSSFTTADSSDNTRPSVVGIDPPNGATGVDPRISISVTFSEPINPATVNTDTFIILVDGTSCTGGISFSPQNTTASFRSDQPFPYVSQVTITLTTGITDLAGNAMASPFTSSFTTVQSTRLAIAYSGPTTLNIGDPINIEVTNLGGVDTTLTYTVKLSDMMDAVVYQNLINDMVQGGASKNYSFQIPDQTADGFYDLYTEAIDNAGRKTVGIYKIKIVGLNATLSTKTEKDLYLPAESVTGISTLTNGPLGIEGASLKVGVAEISSTVSGTFSHFLPRKGWAPISAPFVLAMAPHGELYVSDGFSYIQKYDSKRKFVTMWGGEGSADGQFELLSGVAVGPDGSVYVADRWNFRIQKFDTNGNFITSWGSPGTDNGKFGFLHGVAVGPDGSVYVADENTWGVQKFDGNGHFITKWGSRGAGDGQFGAAYGIAVGPDGSIYVTDSQNKRVQRFDANGIFLNKWGAAGTGDGQFSDLSGIAIGRDSSVYVMDANRVQQFDSIGRFVLKWGSEGQGNGQFNYPEAIAVGSNGSIYVGDFWNDRIQEFDSYGNFISKLGKSGMDDGEFQDLYGIAVGPDGSIYATDRGNCRFQKCVQKFDNNGNFVSNLGSYGTGDGQFSEPFGIAVGTDGSVYVGDSQGRIEKFDNDGNFIAKFGSKGSGDGQIGIPMGIAIGPDGSVYVADASNGRIDKFDSYGNFVTKWGGFSYPEGISVGPDGSVYVSDAWNNSIQKFDSSGNFIAKWGGSVGAADGQFNQPVGVAVGSDGFVYVSDLGNNRIQKFDENGNFIAKWESRGYGDGQFYYPSGVALGPDGSTYVFDRVNHIQRMRPVTETLFEASTPINQPANTTQNYLTQVGMLNDTGKFRLEATLTNNFEQAIAQSSSSFYVGSQEQVISVNPTTGKGNVPINTSVTVLFSQPVDRTTVENISFSLVQAGTGGLVTGTFSFEFNDRLVVFTPSAYLNPNTNYVLNLTRDIRSVSGIPLGQPYSGSFTTAGLADTVSPTVTVSPRDGATEVPVNTFVVFAFSKPVNAMTVNSSTLIVASNGSPVSGNITFNPTNTVVTFVPLSSLLPNTTFNITLSHQVTDLPGNSIVGNGGQGTDFVSNFSTNTLADSVPPQVLSIDPPNGGPISNPAGSVSVTFSEPINAATVNEGTFTLSMDGANVSGQISFSGQNTIATFTPNQPFPAFSTVTVMLTTGISDMAGNTMALLFTSIFSVPSGAILNIAYSGPNTLTLGDTNNITVSNTGNLGTSLAYNVTLSDNTGITIYQNTIADTIQMGSTNTYGFQVPNQAAQGDYTLHAEATDNTGKRTTGTFNVKITGLSATLNTKTNQDIYSPLDSILGTTSLLNGPFGIEGGSLKVSATQISQSTEFSQFLPKEGWWPFSLPQGVSVGPDGSVYVADSRNEQIQKIDSNGNFIAKWGSLGSGDGQFNNPVSIAVGPDGSVYVGDFYNCRIQKFDSNGNFIMKWGSYGSGDGQFNNPAGIAIGPDGSVYVADPYKNRIQKFDGSGNFVTKWGSTGSGDGQFVKPSGVAVSSDGSVYVADSFNYRIQKFDSNGTFITRWGNYCWTDPNSDGVPEQECNGQFSWPSGIAVGPDGLVYVVDLGNSRIQKFDSNGTFVAKWGNLGSEDEQFPYPNKGVAVAPDGSVYVADPDHDGIRKFANNGNLIAKWAASGSEDGHFCYPGDIRADSEGSLYVADSNNNRIQKFDRNGNFISKWGNYGDGDGQFNYPEGIAVAPDGSVYVADSSNNRIQKFDSNGDFIRKWGSYGSGDAQFDYPVDIAVGPDGSVYVADYNHRIQKFDSNGNLISKWGNYGDGDGQLDYPEGIAVAPDGSVYVADSFNNRIQKFDSNGNFVLKWGSGGDEDGQFNEPSGVAIGNDGSVYVVDSGNSRIQKFDSNGTFIAKWGTVFGGQFNFDSPSGITVVPNGSVYVADTYNSRIQWMTTEVIVQTVFKNTLPINQSAGTTQDYTTNIGAIGIVSKLYLEAILTNSLGQTLAQSNYPFYIFAGDTLLLFNTDKKVYAPGETVVITGQVQNRGVTDLANLVLSFNSKYPNQNSQSLYSENFGLPAGGSHTFTATTSAGAGGTVTLTGQVNQNGSVLVEIVDRYAVASP